MNPQEQRARRSAVEDLSQRMDRELNRLDADATKAIAAQGDRFAAALKQMADAADAQAAGMARDLQRQTDADRLMAITLSSVLRRNLFGRIKWMVCGR